MNLEQNVSVWLEDLLVFWLFPLISLLNLAPNSGIRLFFFPGRMSVQNHTSLKKEVVLCVGEKGEVCVHKALQALPYCHVLKNS